MLLKNTSHTVLLLYLLMVGCNTDNSSKETGFTKSKIEINKPTFNKLSKKYIREKRKVSHEFYRDILGSDQFNGEFIVAKNGTIIFEKNNGFANVETKKKIDQATPLHLASISKVATSIAILRLVDQNKIILDEDIRNFLPDIPYEGISVRMLMNHRSGIPYYGYFTYNVWNLGKILKNKDLLMLLKKFKFPLNFPPNSHFAYCNTNYALLALIIEKVTKQSFPMAMQNLIFKPLKMQNSFIMEESIDKKKVSQSYNSRFVNQGFDYLDAVYGDKNMYSTARDLLKMDIGTYSEDFLSKASKKEMFKGYSYEFSGTKNYGLGLRIVELENYTPYFFHTGWWHGNTGCYATLRADTVCLIALSNVYSRSVYRINRLSTTFGNYPFHFEDIE